MFCIIDKIESCVIKESMLIIDFSKCSNDELISYREVLVESLLKIEDAQLFMNLLLDVQQEMKCRCMLCELVKS